MREGYEKRLKEQAERIEILEGAVRMLGEHVSAGSVLLGTAHEALEGSCVRKNEREKFGRGGGGRGGGGTEDTEGGERPEGGERGDGGAASGRERVWHMLKGKLGTSILAVCGAVCVGCVLRASWLQCELAPLRSWVSAATVDTCQLTGCWARDKNKGVCRSQNEVRGTGNTGSLCVTWN